VFEGVENLFDGLNLFKVAKIIKTEKHPNADRLKVCDVSLGKKEFKKVESLLEAKKSGIGYVSGDRKKEGIFPNMSIYENMVIPLYKGKQAKTSGGFLGFIKWME
jgi:ABC-type sugar transport system ATPase subunit